MNRVDLPQNDIVLVTIDDKSLQELGRWPWDRKIHAQLLDTLFNQGAKIAAFYITFYYSSDQEDDNIFISTLEKYPTVLIDASIISEYKNKPFWQKISKTSHLGHNFLPVGNDNTIRRKFLYVDNKPSFTLAILQMINKDKYRYYKTLASSNNVIHINFKRLSYLFPKYSYYDVLNGNFTPDAFKNKIVLIAPTSKGITEYHATPFSINQSNWSSGTESVLMVQAQILDSLLHFENIVPFNYHLLFTFLLIFIGLLFIILHKLGIFRQVILSFIVLPSLFLLISLITLQETSIWITPLPFLIATFLCFMTVSISVIVKTSTFLDKYISELSGQYKDNINLDSNRSVDSKLISLKNMTDIISADKNILDTVLTSVSSIIMLFDGKGNVVYSNHPIFNKYDFNITELSKEINLQEIKQVTSQRIIYKKSIKLKINHYNFIVTVAKGNLYVGVLNDISDMVKMNEMKSNMLRMLSHEFKTPLATILLCSDYIKELNKNDILDQYIDKISGQTVFLEEMIDDFLALNKLEVSDFQITREKTNVRAFINDIISHLKVLAESKNISLTLFIDEDFPETLFLDNKYMQIALKNVIDNAIKYSPQNTEIQTKLTKLNDQIRICIKDQGFGIKLADLKHLFDKFYRIKNDKTTGIKGTGLGLSFVKRIIEVHGGEITVKSEENQGSEFIITLPIN
jgi:signal transduction histidine kinase/CHASE2 domain-containing sensor protein